MTTATDITLPKRIRSTFHRLTFRIILLRVSPLVVRLVAIPDYLFFEELHEILQLTLG